MAHHRMDRVNELLKREVGLFLFHVAGSEPIDMSAVTVTRVETAPNLRDARVYVSIRGDGEQHKQVLGALRRHRADFQKRVAANMKLKYTPRLHFESDAAPEKGHRILCLLEELEEEARDNNPAQKEDDDGAWSELDSRQT